MTFQLLQNKTILITGASGDIGKAIAETCLAQGARVVLHGNKTFQKMKDYFTQKYPKHSCHFIKFNATNENQVAKAIEKLQKDNITLDGIVNNAGDLIERKYFQEMEWQLFLHSFEVNVKSAFLVTKYAFTLLNKLPSIVMVSSMTARGGKGDRSTHYGMAKGAMISRAKSLANELGPSGIRVNSIAPGYIQGNFHDKYTKKEVEIEHALNNPLRRVGKPEDVAGVVVFLLSDLSAYVNGATIDINGGSYMS